MTSNILSFNASSTFAAGVGAHVNVIVDGQTIGSTYVGATAADYSFNVTLTPDTAHDIQLVYDNDTVIDGQDRNLLLNSITVNGQTIAANSSYEVYHAQGQGNIASSGAMNWMGTAEFNLPASVFTPQTTSTTAATTTPTTAAPINTISFNASSTLAAGVGAHVDVIVDGQTVGSTYVGATAANYSFNTTFAPNTAHDIQIVYDNDTVINGQDRNLQLNSITVNGQTIAANSSYEVYHAQGQGNIASSGAMNWMGTAEFNLPASVFAAQTTSTTTAPTTAAAIDTISFNASSTFADGVGAHVDVIVDGQTVGSTYVGATAANYSFNTTFAPNTAHDIQIVYDNDTVADGQDRNLQLNSITVNGQTIAATSSSEVYHAQGQGNIASSGAHELERNR